MPRQNHYKQVDLTRNRNINRWKKKLTDRFRMHETKVLILLIENKYIVENVRNQRSIFFYVQSVVRHCKNVNFMIVFSQLFWAWNYLDSNFQRDIEKFEFFIIVLNFIQKMKKMQIVWKRYYVKKISSKKIWQSSFSQYDQQYNQQSINQNYNRNQQYDNNNRNNNNQNYNNHQNDRNNNQQNDQNRYDQSFYFINFRSINQQQKFIEIFFSKQTSWQKTFWNAFSTFSFSTSIYYTNAIDEKYFEKTYHVEKENHDENEKNQSHNVMIDVYFNDHNQLKYDLTFYTCDQNHFVMIFDNFVELWNHVLNYHDTNIRFSIIKYRNKNVEYKQHAKKHVYNFFSSIFMNYVMIQTSIFDFELTSCLNIDENVFLCDRNLLSKNRNRYDFVYFIKFIIIIDVIEMQIFDQYIEQKMLLSSNKIFIEIKTYFVNDFQLDFIIKTNVLNKKDIDFLFNRRMFRVKNIEISLIYISFSINDNATNYFIYENIYMKNNEIINEIDEYENYFYHFVIFHTNNNDVIKSKTRK